MHISYINWVLSNVCMCFLTREIKEKVADQGLQVHLVLEGNQVSWVSLVQKEMMWVYSHILSVYIWPNILIHKGVQKQISTSTLKHRRIFDNKSN